MSEIDIVEYLIVGILILISFNDIRHMEVPDSLSFLLIVIGLFNGWYNGNFENRVLGMGTYIIPFILIYGYLANLLKKEILGFGDIKLVMGIGAVVGYRGLSAIYFFFTNSFVLAGVYCMVKVLIRRKKMKILLPFAPFLAINAIITMFFL